MPGAGRTHGPPAKKMQAAGTTGSAETSRHSPRGWLERLLRVLPVAPGFLATVACATRERRRKRDISIGMPGPRDLTVRIDDVRRHDKHAATSTRPPHPALNVRDDRETPLYRGGTASVNINFWKKEIEIFFMAGRTGLIQLIGLLKSVF
jgi:hypothetical protein